MYSLSFYVWFLFAQFQLQPGDLLFQDSDCGPFCDAIERVTMGYMKSNLSHVGMVVNTEDGTLAVIEAASNGVVLTTLESFLNRTVDINGDPKVIVGRMKDEFQSIVPKAIEHAIKRLGAAYDDAFDISNDKYYCSELIYEAFEVANHGTEVFSLYPMTFKDPETKELFPVWEKYFQDLGIDVPEGEFGLNPGGISRSHKLNIVYIFGLPDNIEQY